MEKKLKPMSLRAINKALKNRDNLSEDEKTQVVKSIYANPKANQIAFRGAFSMGRFDVAASLALYGAFRKTI